MAKVHHTAICTTDVDASVRFWRDGMGFVATMDQAFDGDWPALFGAPSSRLRSVFLGDPSDPTGGILELVDFGALPEQPASAPHIGFLLVSVYADIDAVLDRLDALGLARDVRRTNVSGVDMAVVRDPNGVRVELIGLRPPETG
jgi:glyoxylase I family protein